MRKAYCIEVDELDVGRVIDGLEIRAAPWEQTAKFHLSGKTYADFIVDKCREAAEAEKIAAHYRSIISKIIGQRNAQS